MRHQTDASAPILIALACGLILPYFLVPAYIQIALRLHQTISQIIQVITLCLPIG
jgi:hypothetical protein